MKVVIIIAEKSVYEQTLVVETDDMDYLKKILAEKVEGNASDVYQVMDILQDNGVTIVDKEENDSYPSLEIAEIEDVYELKE